MTGSLSSNAWSPPCKYRTNQWKLVLNEARPAVASRRDLMLIITLATVGVLLAAAVTAIGMDLLVHWAWPAAVAYGILLRPACPWPIALTRGLGESVQRRHGSRRIRRSHFLTLRQSLSVLSMAKELILDVGGRISMWVCSSQSHLVPDHAQRGPPGRNGLHDHRCLGFLRSVG